MRMKRNYLTYNVSIGCSKGSRFIYIFNEIIICIIICVIVIDMKFYIFLIRDREK